MHRRSHSPLSSASRRSVECASLAAVAAPQPPPPPHVTVPSLSSPLTSSPSSFVELHPSHARTSTSAIGLRHALASPSILPNTAGLHINPPFTSSGVWQQQFAFAASSLMIAPVTLRGSTPTRLFFRQQSTPAQPSRVAAFRKAATRTFAPRKRAPFTRSTSCARRR